MCLLFYSLFACLNETLTQSCPLLCLLPVTLANFRSRELTLASLSLTVVVSAASSSLQPGRGSFVRPQRLRLSPTDLYLYILSSLLVVKRLLELLALGCRRRQLYLFERSGGDRGGGSEDEPSVRPLWEDRLPDRESELPGQGELDDPEKRPCSQFLRGWQKREPLGRFCEVRHVGDWVEVEGKRPLNRFLGLKWQMSLSNNCKWARLAGQTRLL